MRSRPSSIATSNISPLMRSRPSSTSTSNISVKTHWLHQQSHCQLSYITLKQFKWGNLRFPRGALKRCRCTPVSGLWAGLWQHPRRPTERCSRSRCWEVRWACTLPFRSTPQIGRDECEKPCVGIGAIVAASSTMRSAAILDASIPHSRLPIHRACSLKRLFEQCLLPN